MQIRQICSPFYEMDMQRLSKSAAFVVIVIRDLLLEDAEL